MNHPLPLNQVRVTLLDDPQINLGRGGPRGGARPGLPLLLAEKAPLLALSAAAGAATFFLQRTSGAVKGFDVIPIVPRVFNAAVSYAGYLGKTVCPFDLSPFYPHRGPDLSLAAVLAAFVLLLAVTAVVRTAWRRRPWLAVGWLWYLGTLLPVSGIIQVGWQGMADRYTYLPLTGIFIGAAWEAGRAPGRRARLAAAGGSALLLAALGVLTWRQAAVWRDDVSVFTQAVAATTDNLFAEYLLGRAHRVAGNRGEAIRHQREAIRINPRFPFAHARSTTGWTAADGGSKAT